MRWGEEHREQLELCQAQAQTLEVELATYKEHNEELRILVS